MLYFVIHTHTAIKIKQAEQQIQSVVMFKFNNFWFTEWPLTWNMIVLCAHTLHCVTQRYSPGHWTGPNCGAKGCRWVRGVYFRILMSPLLSGAHATSFVARERDTREGEQHDAAFGHCHTTLTARNGLRNDAIIRRAQAQIKMGNAGRRQGTITNCGKGPEETGDSKRKRASKLIHSSHTRKSVRASCSSPPKWLSNFPIYTSAADREKEGKSRSWRWRDIGEDIKYGGGGRGQALPATLHAEQSKQLPRILNRCASAGRKVCMSNICRVVASCWLGAIARCARMQDTHTHTCE